MSELHPIIGARISDHVDTLSATFEVMNVSTMQSSVGNRK